MQARRPAHVVLPCLIFVTTLISTAPTPSRAQGGPPPMRGNQTISPSTDELMRMPWVPPASPAFLRSWLICGRFSNPPIAGDEGTLTKFQRGVDTDYLTNYADEGAAQPTAGAQEPLSGGKAATWTTYSSPTDVIDLNQVYSGQDTTDCVAYAYTTVNSAKAEDRIMTVGSDDSVKVWLNGKAVLRNVAARSVTADNDLVNIHLNQGKNTILVKIVNGGGGWGFIVRIVNPVDLGITLFRPSVGSETTDHKVVVTTALGNVATVPIEVSIVAAGGKIVNHRKSTLGQQITFDTGSWPSGAYEARCFATFPNGEQPFTHVAFYHGDALAAARKLIATAPANAQTEAELNHAMLADLIRLKIGDTKAIQSLTHEQVNSIISPLMEWEEIQSNTQIRPYGFVRFAYRDPIDDSPQFCRVFLPPDYTPKKKWPMVVILHGANFGNPSYIEWGIDDRHMDRSDLFNVIEVEPMGRYNSFYAGMGEQDVLHSIQTAKERLSVDEDRVYLGGISMGGAGTWGVGSRHPEIFAAITPDLGVFDYHVTTPASEIEKLNPIDVYFREASSTLVGVESLLTMPILVNHGDKDPVINVNQSRYAVRMLQRWGYNVRYWEHPGGLHGDFNTNPVAYPWYLQHTRVNNPVKIRLRSADIKTASSYWLRVTEKRDPFQLITAEAEIIRPNRINVSSENALSIKLTPKGSMIDPSKPVEVSWNGVVQPATMLTNGTLTLHAADYEPAAGDKNAKIAGPLSDITNTPFAIVVGTQSSDPEVNAFNRKWADNFVAQWQRAQHCDPRVFIDTQVTDDQIAKYSLYLIGGADANAVTAKLGNQLPIQVANSKITIGGRAFDAPAATAYQAIFPNPRNSERYVRVCGATSASALAKIGSIPDGEYDFGIIDANTGDPIAGGVFDAHWHCTDAGTLLGKDAQRESPRGPGRR